MKYELFVELEPMNQILIARIEGNADIKQVIKSAGRLLRKNYPIKKTGKFYWSLRDENYRWINRFGHGEKDCQQ